MRTWQRLEDLFDAALALSPDERSAFLDDACPDTALRREVESLLVNAGDDRLRRALAATAEEMVANISDRVGQRVGPYRVSSLIGEGGMGAVYRASRDDGQYQRDVALKLLNHWLASQQVVARFRDERQILANLTHPAIVRLLDGGTTDDGWPYLVMELIDGEPLDRYAARLSIRDRVRLLLAVCEPLQYAHERLIVHRDIKPSNILVTATGEPKLLDFGIAKLLEPTSSSRAALTRTGVALLTPEYASPEQARGDLVSVASDVYSLGAVFFHLLTGHPPQSATDDVLATLRRICELDAPLPSSICAPEHRRQITGDLDNIALRALQKDPTARYPSVAAFADDLRAYLEGRPVRARAATLRYRAGKFVRRHRIGLTLIGLVATALVTLTIVSVLNADEAQRRARALLVEQARQALSQGYASQALPYLAQAWSEGEDTPMLRFLVAEAQRPFARELTRVTGYPEGIYFSTLSRARDKIVVCGNGGRVAVYDTRGTLLRRLDLDEPLRVEVCTFDPSGTRVAAQTREGRATVWDLETGRQLWSIRRPLAPIVNGWTNQVNGFAFGDHHLVTARVAHQFERLDAATGELLSTAPFGGSPGALVMTDDGEHTYLGTGPDHVIRELDPTGTARIILGPEDLPPISESGPLAFRFSGDQRRLFMAYGPDIFEWDVAARRVVRTFDGHVRQIVHLSLSSDERWLASAAGTGEAKIWDLTTGRIHADLPHRTDITYADFDRDGTRIATTSLDGFYRIFRVSDATLLVAQEVVVSAGSGTRAPAIPLLGAFAANDTTIVSHIGTELLLWRAEHDALLVDLSRHAAPAGTWSPNRDRLLTTTAPPSVHTVDGHLVATLASVPPHACFSASWSVRDILAVGCERGYLSLHAANGERLHVLSGHNDNITGTAFSPDGAHIATASDDGTVRLWDANTGVELGRLLHDDRVMALDWSRDGQLLATAEIAGVLRVWNVARRQVVDIIREPGLRFLSVAFNADDTGLFAGARERVAALWDRATGTRRVSYVGHTAQVTWIDDSPDGAIVASASVDLSLRIWDAKTGIELGRRMHLGEIIEGQWLDDERVAIFTHALVWDVSRTRGESDMLQAFVNERVPWRLVGERLELVTRP